jgi:hypothetical protein
MSNPDESLVSRFRHAVGRKLSAPNYLGLARRFERGMLFVEVDSPYAFADEFWRLLERALDGAVAQFGVEAVTTVLAVSRVDDRAAIRRYSR